MEPGVERRMYTLLVEMRCQSYCLFCGAREVDEALVRTRRRLGLSVPPTNYGATRGRFTLETASEALRNARRDGYTELSLQGGEPTVFPQLPEVIAVARGLAFDFVGMVSNGRKLANREYTRSLLEAGLHGLTVSLLGADAETHDAIAAAPGAFDGLVAGLGHAGELVRTLGLPVKVNANVIVTARSVDQLPAQVRLLAQLGVHAATLRLVRFKGMAADPIVREMLRFDIERIRAPLAEAMAEAARLGIGLHPTDVPLCLHPRPTPSELERLARYDVVTHHHYEAAAFEYELSDAPGPRLDACRGCLVERTCRRVPAEYLPDDARTVLRPLGAASLRATVDDTLAALDPAQPGAAARLAELAATVELLERAGGQPLTAAAARIDEALGDLLVLAARRRDADEAMGALCAMLGLRAPKGFQIDDATWSSIELPAEALARRVGASPHPQGTVWLRIGRFAIALDADRRDDGALVVRAVRPRLDAATTPASRIARALFLGVLAPPLRGLRRLHLRDDGLDADDGVRRQPIFSSFRRGAITCVDASHGPASDRDAVPGS